MPLSCQISTLWKALFIAYGRPYVVAAGLKIIQDLLAFLQPQLLRWLLSYISWYQISRLQPIDGSNLPSKLEGLSIALIMFVASVVQTITVNQVCLHLVCSNSTNKNIKVFSTHI